MKRKWKNLLKRAGIILLLSAVLTQTAGSYVYAETETDTAEHLYQEQEEITENTESQENTEDEKEVNAGENKTAGGLFFYLCRLRKSIHGLRQFQTEILLPRMLCQEPFQRR